MPWWPNAFSSSSPKHPRLTRQKKVRHLHDAHLGSPLRSGTSSPQFSDLPSPQISSEFSLVLPQPLPRPDGSPKRNSNSPVPIPIPTTPNLNSILADFPLPSPKEAVAGAVIRGVEERDKSDAAAADGVPSNSAIVSRRFSHQDGRKSMEHVDTRSSRKGPQYQGGATRIFDNFRLNVPFQSAPTSPLSSPMPSPQRMSTGALLSSQYTPCPGRLSIDMSSEMVVAFPYQASPAFTPDTSPINSPVVKSPRWSTRSPALSGPASPLHKKLSLEASSARRESNGNVNNVHPLPLPPGVSMPSTPTPVTTKPDLVPMTNQWQKGKLIGRGTFGSVYVATNRETGALCAMKEVELLPDDRKSAECIKQLEQEIKVLSQLKHPNIVQYYGSEIVDDCFYIYLEYVHPGSINKYVREHCGAMTESVVRNFTRHILSGLAYLHSTKTIHRDIKGANLLVDASGVVKLADFGMAKHLTGAAADLSLKGSPYWMAPELMNSVMQKDSSSDLALAVDIWSLGCTIIEMLNGKPPWSEYEGAAAMFKVMRESPPIPETLSAEGKDFLRCCFRRNPAERPSASMLLEHRFVNNQHQLDVSCCTQTFNGIKLVDKAQSPRERSPRKSEPVPTSSSTQTQKGKLPCNGESGKRYHLETSDLTGACRHSPRSTLDNLPSLSPPHSGCTALHSSLSAPISGSIKRSARRNHIF